MALVPFFVVAPSCRTKNASSKDAGAVPRSDGAIRDANQDAASSDAGVMPSVGCGNEVTGSGAFVARSIDVAGATRTYWLLVPRTYDPARAYPIVFKWHGYTGNGLSGGLGIEVYSKEDAIVVGGDGLGTTWAIGASSPDLAFFDAMLGELSATYCIDRARVFSYGFSRGGGFSNLLACVRGDVIRASAAIEGLDPGVSACKGNVAAWILHDDGDPTVSVAQGRAVRDRFRRASGCRTTATAVTPAPCVRYDGCRDRFPVEWCETTGYGHDIRGDFAPAVVWAFFDSLP